jgi:thymidine phosphorylase
MSLATLDLLHCKRAGKSLGGAELQAFARAIASGEVSDAQLGAFAMAVCLRGMSLEEMGAWTLAVRDSGKRLDWSALRGNGPVLDKHSTGGVGDCVSLVLAPMLAACGAYVPMLSGRGLGHTGGTLDKLEAIPGYRVDVDDATLQRVVAEAGLAIVGAGPALAPADRRLYAVRDVTATVDSLPLIVASILSKKLAAGADALVLDVKHGSGASAESQLEAMALARALREVAGANGLRTAVLLTDMDEPLAPAVGNALELHLCLRYLAGEVEPPRLHQVTMALGIAALRLGGLAGSDTDAREKLLRVRASGHAAERFARMVHALGGPADVFRWAADPRDEAPVRRCVPAPNAGVVVRADARAMGVASVELGAGRAREGQPVDPRVGLSDIVPVGSEVEAGAPLAWVHAADEASAQRACARLRAAFVLGLRAEGARTLVQPLPPLRESAPA